MAVTVAQVAVALGMPEDTDPGEVYREADRRITTRRDGLVAAAVADGRLLESSRDKWRAELDRGGAASEKMLASLAPVLRPNAEKLIDEADWFPGFPARGAAA